jgi:uncharacterized membrane protein (DUF2068 family)
MTESASKPLSLPSAKALQRSRWVVRLIGISKILKSVLLLALAIGVTRLLSPTFHQTFEDYVNQARLDPYSHHLNDLLEKVLAIPEKTLHYFRVGLLIYAGIYSIEGIGLLANRKWAEWMVVVTTGGFIPIEIYEIIVHITWVKCVVITLNVAILVYLVFHLHQQHRVKVAGGAALPAGEQAISPGRG